MDLNTSYDITDKVQVYGLVKNLFNSKYGLYGTYFEVDEVEPYRSGPGRARLQRSAHDLAAMPFAAYGGVKVKY